MRDYRESFSDTFYEEYVEKSFMPRYLFHNRAGTPFYPGTMYAWAADDTLYSKGRSNPPREYTQDVRVRLARPKLVAGRDEVKPSDGHRPTAYFAFDLKNDFPGVQDHLLRGPTPQGKLDVYSNDYREGVDGGLSTVFTAPGVLSAVNHLGERIYYPDVPGSVTSRAHNSLQSKIAAKQLDLAVTVAELGESLSLISETLMTSARLYRAGRRGDIREVQRILGRKFDDLADFLGSSTLAVQLGWRPLINDASSIARLVIDGLEKRPPVTTVKSSASSTFDYPSSFNGWRCSGTYRCDVSYSVTFTVASDFVDGLRRLGLINPATVGWELVPFSFVVDWFVNIGGFLEQFTNSIGLSFLHGYRTDYTELKGRLAVDVNEPPWWIAAHGPRSEFNGSQQGMVMNRKLLTGFPAPRLNVGTGVSSFSRASTAIALVQQLSKGKMARRT